MYTLWAKKVKEWKITFCGKNSEGSFKMLAADYYFKSLLEFWDWDIGKTVFLSKEEAEESSKRGEHKPVCGRV